MIMIYDNVDDNCHDDCMIGRIYDCYIVIIVFKYKMMLY